MVKWFKNKSIRIKLLIILLIINTFLTSSSLIALRGVQKMNSDTIKIYNNDLTSIEQMHKLNESLLTVKNLVTLVTYNNSIDIEYVKNETNKNILRDNDILKEFEKQGIPQTVKPTYEEFKSYLYKVRDLRNTIFDKISSQDYVSARQIYNQYVLVRDEMYDKLDEVISLFQDNALNNYNDNISTFESTYKNILIISITEFFVFIILGVILSNYFTQRLKRYVRFAKEIAEGSISNFIAVDSSDEIGQLGMQLNTAGSNIRGYLTELRNSENILKEQVNSLLVMELKLRTSEERYRLVVDGVNDGVWDIDYKTSMIYLSERCKEILNINHSKSDISFSEIERLQNNQDYKHIKVLNDFAKKCTLDKKEFVTENFIIDINEYIKHVLIRGKILYDEDRNVCRFTGSITDTTEQSTAIERANYLAYYDPLTNLPNKISLRDRLIEACHGVNNNHLRTLILIDIDNFKNINEVYGYEIGDELILELSKRLEKIRRESDILYYDSPASFAFYSDKYANKTEIEKEANKINNIVSITYLIRNNKINITASIGISYIPLGIQPSGSLLKDAEIALSSCKKNNKNSFVFYTIEMEKNIRRKVTIYNDLIAAIENKQFVLYYQPKVNINDNSIEGMEALLRWNHPINGIISPIEFIGIAEETGIIVEIGYYVIEEACIQIKKWHENGFSDLKVAINLSIKQLMQADFVEKVEEILKMVGVIPQWIEFEITESLVMNNYDDAILKVNKLRNLGITIALDDFGTGYSSLNYLNSLPIDSIKLDKTFIDKINKEDKSKVIIQALVSLAHSIKLNIIAEGVETVDQLHLLKQFQCDAVQGYLFSKPLNIDELDKLLQRNFPFHNCQSIVED